MNKYEDDIELIQEVHRVAKETCTEHTPDIVRKELKNTMYLLSGSILAIGAGIMLIVNMLREDISLQGEDIRSQGKMLNKIYEVASKLDVTEARVAVVESEQAVLKKNVVSNTVQISALRNEVRNIKISNIAENQ